MNLYKAEVEVAVLLVFFARPDTFQKVFNQIKKARPSKLFLYQDGPRDGRKDDVVNIKKCREIAEDIDWECDVHRFYQTENQGCDLSGYVAHTCSFSNVNKCIVIEDDIVPSVSFIRFCKEMLDKYENDKRISMIGGFNLDEITPNIEEDYFFTSCTTSWGWASWSRVVLNWDPSFSILDSKEYVNLLEGYIEQKKHMKNFISYVKYYKDHNIPCFEPLMMINHYLNNCLMILPTKNMINNIGVTENATHFGGDIELLPKGYRKIFLMKRYEIEGDIKHPKYMIENVSYKDRSYRIKGWGHPFVKAFRLVESSLYMLKKGKFSKMIENAVEKIQHTLHRRSY